MLGGVCFGGGVLVGLAMHVREKRNAHMLLHSQRHAKASTTDDLQTSLLNPLVSEDEPQSQQEAFAGTHGARLVITVTRPLPIDFDSTRASCHAIRGTPVAHSVALRVTPAEAVTGGPGLSKPCRSGIRGTTVPAQST